MENVSHAIFLAFAMFTLVIGLSFGIYLIGSLNSVASTLIESSDKTNTYQKVSYDSSKLLRKVAFSSSLSSDKSTVLKNRIVSSDVVVSTIYRYYKDVLTIEIYDCDENGKIFLNQIFDLDIERGVLSDPNYSQGYQECYNKQNTPQYLFGAPWVDSQENIKKRIDFYVTSKKGYIGTNFIDYESKTSSGEPRGLKNLISERGSSKFLEEFIEYTYDGDTYTETNGDDIETITGNVKEQKKTIIRYTIIP